MYVIVLIVVHRGCPALGLGSVTALALTDSLLIYVFPTYSIVSSCIYIRRANMGARFVVLHLGHANMDMRNSTANLASSWTLSWNLRFYGQPSGGTTRRDWIRWAPSSSFLPFLVAPYTWVFDWFLVACVPTSYSHCLLCSWYSFFISFVLRWLLRRVNY